jgi:hypothetical protein
MHDKGRNIMIRNVASKLSPALALGLTMLLAPAAVHAADEAPVVLQPRIMLSQAEYARLQAVANRGSEALRRYIWRTRLIYNYYLPDLVATRETA